MLLRRKSIQKEAEYQMEADKISFNQDYGCFSVIVNDGFRIFNADPLKEKMRREFANNKLQIVQMLFRTNYLAVVGDISSQKYPPNKLFIWDDLKAKCILDLKFEDIILDVKLRRDRIIIVLENKVYVYTFSHNPQRLYVYDTISNEKGLCCLSPSSDNVILAFPGLHVGQIQIIDLADAKKTPILLQAHSTRLQIISVSLDGKKVATASEKGTLIRIFDTNTGKQLNELRRGADRAYIFSISFDQTANRICVSSDKGTIHIFNINSEIFNTEYANTTSSVAFMKGVLPKYFSSEWSFVKIKIPSGNSFCICAFGMDNKTIIAICADGSWYRYIYDINKPGDTVLDSYKKFLQDTQKN